VKEDEEHAIADRYWGPQGKRTKGLKKNQVKIGCVPP